MNVDIYSIHMMVILKHMTKCYKKELGEKTMKPVKTNVMRVLDKEKIAYTVTSYEVIDGKIDGLSVASKIGKPKEKVFKTLVTIGTSKEYYVFVIPVEEEIDFKKASKLTDEKNIQMIPVNELQKITGYIRGGCSPIGMKKQYKTYIHETVEKLDEITFSAGKIGVQITTNPTELKRVVPYKIGDIVKK